MCLEANSANLANWNHAPPRTSCPDCLHVSAVISVMQPCMTSTPRWLTETELRPWCGFCKRSVYPDQSTAQTGRAGCRRPSATGRSSGPSPCRKWGLPGLTTCIPELCISPRSLAASQSMGYRPTRRPPWGTAPWTLRMCPYAGNKCRQTCYQVQPNQAWRCTYVPLHTLLPTVLQV